MSKNNNFITLQIDIPQSLISQLTDFSIQNGFETETLINIILNEWYEKNINL